MIRSVRVLISVFALATAACGGSPAVDTKEAAASATAARVPKDQVVLTPAEQATGKIETQTIGETTIPDVLQVSGRIARADDRTWRVGVRTDGLVRSVLVNLGDVVRQDQILARYHADEVREGRAKYQTAVAELQRLEAAAALARRSAERLQTLLELKAASALQVDQAKQDVVGADAALKNGRTEVERAKDLLEDELHVPLAADAANDTASQVPIFAPAAGFILEKNITPGRTVAPGQDAFVIADLSRVWMVASVRQENIEAVQAAKSAIVTVAGLSQTYPGTVANLGQEFDAATRMLQIRIVLDNPGLRLRPEMLATANVAVGDPKPRLVVPADAVQQINGQDVVFVKTTPDRFTVRAVRVGPTVGGRSPVLEGLNAGDQVVVRGSFVLKSHLLRASMEGE